MVAIADKKVAHDFMQDYFKGNRDEYAELGFTRKDYKGTIVEACKLPWVHFKQKSFALTCYREETGERPAERQEVEHTGNIIFEVTHYGINGNGNGDKSKAKIKTKGGNGHKR